MKKKYEQCSGYKIGDMVWCLRKQYIGIIVDLESDFDFTRTVCAKIHWLDNLKSGWTGCDISLFKKVC